MRTNKRHQLLINWMKRTYDRYKDETIKIVCLPVPPSPIDGKIFMPDSFCSKVFDQGKIETDEKLKIVLVKPTAFGPAILLYAPFGEFVGFNDVTGVLQVKHATFCAKVSYYILGRTKDIEYADQVVIERVTARPRSCHPGSHYIVPRAPHLTSLLQYSQAPDDESSNKVTIAYLTPEQGEKLFPYCVFDTNRFIDDYVSRCVIDSQISFYRTTGGLGEWSADFLRKLRRNIIEENYNGYELHGDASQEDGRELGYDPYTGRDAIPVQKPENGDYIGCGETAR